MRPRPRPAGAAPVPAPVPGLVRALVSVLVLVLVLALALVLAGCATGKGAVAVGGQYEFIAPHGQQIIHYDPPSSRGKLTGLAGEDLRRPGRTITLNDFPGQVVVINLWGSWCGPCRGEMADLKQLYQSNKARRVTVLGIDLRDTRDQALDFATADKVTYPLIFDQPGRSLASLHGYPRNVTPSTILLDRQHRVAAVYLTAIRVGQLAPVIQQLSAESAG
jgi:thiol-disulfide isomerase/thioredoxin